MVQSPMRKPEQQRDGEVARGVLGDAVHRARLRERGRLGVGAGLELGHHVVGERGVDEERLGLGPGPAVHQQRRHARTHEHVDHEVTHRPAVARGGPVPVARTDLAEATFEFRRARCRAR